MNKFLVLCTVYTIFTTVTNLCNIFLIFHDYLNFWYFTIFGSIKFAVESFINSTLYFTKSVIYLKDITVSTKELFKLEVPWQVIVAIAKIWLLSFIFFYSFIPFATMQKGFKVESLYFNNLLTL